MATKVIRKKIKATNRHWKNFVDKEYLGSHNLEKDEEMLLTIAKYEGEEVVTTERGKEKNQVLYFKEDTPKMILNMTNSTTLASLYGSHPDQWIGKQVQLYSARVKGKGGQTVDGLRIRDIIPSRKVDVVAIAADLSAAKTYDELKSVWVALPASARENKKLLKHKDTLKAKLV